ncbi:unnamed protein product [Bemisia tabaci]|uniref:NADH dehydrogenase [ubiquinone] 1 alpha subcomplex subunit 10, mitochondrial n=1 Tax=Bemisia tabaci TaxID=7038 RepID=A0A9N9ZY87_BEMTA|nr:unnamed protein product [Bemisia tabaci]
MAYAITLKGVNLSSAGKPVKSVFKVCTHSNLKPAFLVASANILGFHKRDPNYQRPKPYPYETKYYGFWQRCVDRTTWRFDDNTKLIIIEGPPAAGKTELAKKLAEDFDMKYVGDATMDDRYISKVTGHDFREFDPQLPPNVRSFDEKDFCKNPTHRNAAIFQVWKYQLRFARYIDALAHILSTGQGVVMERAPFTDIAFAQAMKQSGFMSKQAMYVYNELRRHTLNLLMRPHLFIYLDIPVKAVKDRIKQRDLPHERNSPALTDKFLTDYEMNCKSYIMLHMSNHSDFLMYDWTEGGDVDVVLEDIEKIDFDIHTGTDEKMTDWRLNKEVEWCDMRNMYADKKLWLLTHFNCQIFDAPELVGTGDEDKWMTKFWHHPKRGKYSFGYNADLGDKNILWKSRLAKYWDVTR